MPPIDMHPDTHIPTTHTYIQTPTNTRTHPSPPTGRPSPRTHHPVGPLSLRHVLHPGRDGLGHMEPRGCVQLAQVVIEREVSLLDEGQSIVHHSLVHSLTRSHRPQEPAGAGGCLSAGRWTVPHSGETQDAESPAQTQPQCLAFTHGGDALGPPHCKHKVPWIVPHAQNDTAALWVEEEHCGNLDRSHSWAPGPTQAHQSPKQQDLPCPRLTVAHRQEWSETGVCMVRSHEGIVNNLLGSWCGQGR